MASSTSASRGHHLSDLRPRSEKGTVVLKSISGASNNGKFRERGGGKYLRTCASIVFSTIGVGTILICYIFCGAILFLTLEGNGPITSSTTFLRHSNWGNTFFGSQKEVANGDSRTIEGRDGKSIVLSLGVQEKRQLRIAKELRARTVNTLWKITEELNILYRENWTMLADKEMVKFQNELLSGIWLNDGDIKRLESREGQNTYSSTHQKRHAKLSKDKTRPQSSPITRALSSSQDTSSLAERHNQNASKDEIKEVKWSSKRSRNSSRHSNNSKNKQSSKSKFNQKRDRYAKNENSITEYRTKKKDLVDRKTKRVSQKQSIVLQRGGKSLLNAKQNNKYVEGVTQPTAMMSTNSKFSNPSLENWNISTKSKTFKKGQGVPHASSVDQSEQTIETEEQKITNPSDWSFSASFLYSLSLITTMGYNGKSPKSSMGKIVAMGITIVGIPLLMIYLAVVGAGLARTFLRVYCKLCCCPWLCNARKNRRLTRGKGDKTESLKLQRTPSSNSGLRIQGSGTNLSVMGIHRSYDETDTDINTNSSSNIDKIPPIAAGERSLGSFPVQRETASMTDITDLMYVQQRKCETCSSVIIPSRKGNCSGFGARNSVSAEGENKVFMQGQHIGRRNLHYRNNKGGCGKRVPAWILLFVILAYIGFGAFVFATYQGWNFVDGLFFSFAVLGTIGLIDINPSSSLVSSTTNRDLASEQAEFNPSSGSSISRDDSESDIKTHVDITWAQRNAQRDIKHNDIDTTFVVMCTCYLLIGLAIISMCVQLMEHTCRDILQRLATTRLMGRHGSWMFAVYDGDTKRRFGKSPNGRYWTTSASESPNNSSSWQGLSRQNSRETSVDNLTRHMEATSSRNNGPGYHYKPPLVESLMTNPDGPEGGVITSIATTITIGSHPVTSNSTNSGEPLPHYIHNQPSSTSSAAFNTESTNTFRPILSESHHQQTPSSAQYMLNQNHINSSNSVDMSFNQKGSEVNKYTSLPRSGGSTHPARPSSRASISIPSRGQFAPSPIPSSTIYGSARLNADLVETSIPPIYSKTEDAIEQLKSLKLRQQMHQATTISNTLVKPKPRTGITGLSGQTEETNSSSVHEGNTFPSPRPRTTIAPNNQVQAKLSSSNLLQLPTGINEGSVSSGSSRRSSNSCAQQQVPDDFHLNDTLRALDLDYRDLRNLDPALASNLLEEIKLGADLGPILEKIRASSLPKKQQQTGTKETKSVTFEDEAK